MPDIELAHRIVILLNEMLALDRDATSELCAHHFACTDALAAHPTIKVGPLKEGSLTCYVGLLGVLNGLVGPAEDGHSVIQSELTGEANQDDRQIVRFVVRE